MPDALCLPTDAWTAYRLRLGDERAGGWLSPGQYDALLAIADLNAVGVAEPTIAVIALHAKVSARTVRRARVVAEERGLLVVEKQFEPVGGRRQQRANRYTLTTPQGRVAPRPKPRRQPSLPKPLSSFRTAWPDSMAAPVKADLLAARRAAFEARLRAGARC